MARYLLTFGTDRFAGSRGGSTFQKSGTTYVIRKRNVPVQKKSESQTQKQNQFSSVQQNWRSLDPLDKDTFQNESINYPRTDSLGNTYYITGQNLQASSNINLVQSDQPQITEMPAAVVFPPFAIFESGLYITAQLFECAIDINPIPAGFALQIFASRYLTSDSPSQPIQFKLITSLSPGTDQTGNNYFNQYVEVFGLSPSMGFQYLATMCTLVSIATGQKTNSAIRIDEIAP